MFELEAEIPAWRRTLESGALSKDVLDELESHLRDDIGGRMQAGHTAEEAFNGAVQRLGDAHALEREFRRDRGTFGAGLRRRLKRESSGFVSAWDLKALAIVSAILGVVGFGGMSFLASRYWSLGAPPHTQLHVLAVITLYGLAVHTSLRYLRGRRIEDARGLVAFGLFMTWTLTSSTFEFLTIHSRMTGTPITLSMELGRLGWRIVVLLVAAVAWWFWMRRLERISSGTPPDHATAL